MPQSIAACVNRQTRGVHWPRTHRQLVTLCAVGVAICAHAQQPEPEPGSVLDAESIETYVGLLDETLIELVRAGDYSLHIAQSESLQPAPAYLAATHANAGRTSLGESPGELHGYIAGRPFAEPPRADDPRAGEKLAWNMRYAYAGDSGRIDPFFWQYRRMDTGAIERELHFKAAQLRFMHRTVMAPMPGLPNNPAGIFNALYLRVAEPPDIRDTQLLIHRLEDDTRQEEGWLYLGSQRRVRRLPTGQNTDAFLGSDIMIEDFLGYNGRLMDMDWHYLGTQRALLPFFRHDALELDQRTAGSDGFRFVAFTGRGGCFPRIQWQLREAHVLEAHPKRDDHPLSRRRFYVDTETFAPAYGRAWDDRGELWKLAIAGYSHPDHHLPANRGSQVPILDAVTMIDLQAGHCTTLQARAEVNVSEVQASQFAVQALRVRGR